MHNYKLQIAQGKNKKGMVICWHRAKIEIFLETLEKLLCTSQVLSHIF